MDLNSIDDVVMLRDGATAPAWRGGDAWLAGGTWLFSEPQPAVRRLVDITTLGWDALRLDENGLEIAATCTIAQLAEFAAAATFAAAPLLGQCCRSLLGSFKVWNMATVGGNICMALPAGPMIALTSALGGVGTIWSDGDAARARRVPILDLVTGPHETGLAPGELLRAIHLPAAMLTQATAFRRVSLNPIGRTGALVIGTRDPATSAFALTVTGSTCRPVRLSFDVPPDADTMRTRLDAAIPSSLWFDDVHGDPHWRRHVTLHLADEVRRELNGEHAS